jgi:hypothetical protein
MIRHVYKPSKREGGKRVFDRLYRGRYRLDGVERIREVPLKTSDKQITAKVYTDAGMLPTGDAVMMLPALVTGEQSDSQIDSQKLVTGSLSVSRAVQVLETANVAETLINRGFEADLSRVVPPCPKGEMVRDAGFEPAKRCWLSGTYGCSPTTGPTTYFVA